MAVVINKILEKIKSGNFSRRVFAGIVVIVFVCFGTYFLVNSHAATPSTSINADTGKLTSPAVVQNCSGSSDGKCVVFGSSGFSVGTSAPPTGTSTVVDFRDKTQPLNIYSVGATISTYDGNGLANINKSATWKANLASLGPIAWRIPIRYNGGNPGSSAMGGQSSGDASTYIQNIKSIGGQPVIVVGGNTSDNDFTAADAAGLVHYFNDNGGQHGGPVHSWVIGNEYTNSGNDPIGYQAHLAGWAAAMKGADPTITLSAPAAPDMRYASGPISASITNAAQYIDYLSYHSYQGQSYGLGATSDYETIPESLASQYITTQNFGSRTSQVHMALEEYNWAPYGGSTDFFQWQNTVFTASVIGHSLSAGAHAYEYSDSNGPLGLMNDGSSQNPTLPGSLYTKFPVYWGIGMWTGLNGMFTKYGNNLVQSSSSVANVEVYATDNGKIIAINKDTSDHSITIGLGGITSGNYDVWQTNSTNPTSPPSEVNQSASFNNSTISITLPAGTVSSIDLQ